MSAVLVIPTYNEKNNIQALVEEILNILPEIKILVVDDNSPDGTGKIAERLHQRYGQVSVLHRKRKEGLGKAYIAGFMEVLKMNPDYILQMDADFSHSPEYLRLFLKEITQNDLVLGSRFLDKRKHPSNVSLLSVWSSWFTKHMLGLQVTDCLGGFKCFRKTLIEKMRLDKFISRGFIFQAEFVYRAIQQGARIKEVPIVFYPRKAGKKKKSKKIMFEAFLKILIMRISRT
jgi:dolichol-phosphate mannosyltransferase